MVSHKSYSLHTSSQINDSDKNKQEIQDLRRSFDSRFDSLASQVSHHQRAFEHLIDMGRLFSVPEKPPDQVVVVVPKTTVVSRKVAVGLYFPQGTLQNSKWPTVFKDLKDALTTQLLGSNTRVSVVPYVESEKVDLVLWVEFSSSIRPSIPSDERMAKFISMKKNQDHVGVCIIMLTDQKDEISAIIESEYKETSVGGKPFATLLQLHKEVLLPGSKQNKTAIVKIGAALSKR